MQIAKTQEGLYEVDIDGEKYQFSKWNAEEALDVLLDIIPLVGKPIGAAAAAFVGQEGDSVLDKNLNPQAISAIVESLTSNFNKSIVKSLIVKLSSDKVLCGGAKIVFRTHYEDRLPVVFKVVQAALEVQYGNFFGAVLSMLPARQAPVRNEAQAT